MVESRIRDLFPRPGRESAFRRSQGVVGPRPLNRRSVAAGRTAIGQHSPWFGSVRPLNVLVLLAESGVLSFAPGASPHCVLVCPNPEGAGAALQTFEPDVVL